MSRPGRRALPIAAENYEVGKRRVVTGRVRVTRAVRTRSEVVDRPVTREVIEVRRVRVRKPVDGPVPDVRRQGPTLIVPVLEEVPVVEKRLMVTEEIHITKRVVPERRRVKVTLRREEPVIERRSAPGPGARHARHPDTRR